MLNRFVCLANSHKERGRCLAGIELDNNNEPVIINGLAKWLRPVCNTPHGEVPNYIANRFALLEILQLDGTGNKPQGYQTENIAFNEKTIQAVGNFDAAALENLCNDVNMIFGNAGKTVSKEETKNLSYSLLLLKINTFEVASKTYSENADKIKHRLVFSYNKIDYDLPITDPVFVYHFQNNQEFFKQHNAAFICVSLGIEWQAQHYKLAAGIVLA